MTNRVAELRVAKGWSQAHLAELLSVTRQTVIALEAAKTDPGLALAMRVAWLFDARVESIFFADLDEQVAFLRESWEYRDRAANAFTEERVLEKMGTKAWEMTGFGMNVLQFRRPANPALRRAWQYQRLEGLLTAARRSPLERQGWLYCGSWMGLFHYFKRQANPVSSDKANDR